MITETEATAMDADTTETPTPRPLTREEKLAALLEERGSLSEKVEAAMEAARLLREEYEHARAAGDAETMAAIQPRLAAADQLARDAEAKLTPVARRVREIQLEIEAEAEAASQRRRLTELRTQLVNATGAYEYAMRALVEGVAALVASVRAQRGTRRRLQAEFAAQVKRVRQPGTDFELGLILEREGAYAAAERQDRSTFDSALLERAGAGDVAGLLSLLTMEESDRRRLRAEGKIAALI